MPKTLKEMMMERGSGQVQPQMQSQTPTMVNPIPPDPTPRRGAPAPELDDAIIARPLMMPDFINVKPKNPNVAFRWIEFKAQDGFNFSKAQTQGWVVATQADVADDCISPYMREGGSKFVNGDLILMKMDRNRYLGALKFKHQVAAALSDAAVLRAKGAQESAATLAAAGASGLGVDSRGQPKMSVFTPDAADLSKTPLGTSRGAAEAARLGSEGPPDTGKGQDINK